MTTNIDSFIPFADYLEGSTEARRTIVKPCTYGMDFLNKALIGIHPTEIVVVTAPTGSGKTDFVLNMIVKNLAAGKRVATFLLEGDANEPADRIRWLFISNNPKYQEAIAPYNYIEYRLNKIPASVITPIEDEVNIKLKGMFANLLIYDKSEASSVSNIKANLSQLKGRADLVVIDHLHYFSMFSDKSENTQIKDIMMAINDCSELFRIPVVLVAHTRKSEKFSDEVIPNLDSINGTKSISNVAHTVLTLANFPTELEKAGKFLTLFKVLKSRNGYKNKNCFVKLYDMKRRVYDKGFGECTTFFDKNKAGGMGYNIKMKDMGTLSQADQEAINGEMSLF